VFHVDDVPPLANRPRRALRILFAHELLDATWSVFDGGEREGFDSFDPPDDAQPS
jgi:hypothetical protein